MSFPRLPRGFTLVETMVMCAVSIVLLSLLADVFLIALRRTNDSRLRVDLQQRAVFVLARWERDIESTAAKAMVVRTGDPTCVAFTQAAAINGSGSVVWEDGLNENDLDNEGLICWAFLKAKRRLIRDTYPPKEPAFAQPLSSLRPLAAETTEAELEALVQETSGAEKIMCEDVEDFSLTDRFGGTNLYEQPLLFRLKLRRPLSTAQNFAEFTIERRYTLRNRY